MPSINLVWCKDNHSRNLSFPCLPRKVAASPQLTIWAMLCEQDKFISAITSLTSPCMPYYFSGTDKIINEI
jgi:hypothetical protein